MSHDAQTRSAPFDRLFAAWNEYYVQVDRKAGGYRQRPACVEAESSRRLCAFDRVANLCAERGWDIRDYVIVVVPWIATTKYVVLPEDLAGAGAQTAYVNHIAQRPTKDAYTQSWLDQEVMLRQILARAPSMGTNPRSVLMLSAVALDPWFRVMYAEPDEAMYATYGVACHAELRRNPALREFLRARFAERVRGLERRFGAFGDAPPEAIA
jgi:hypothetical protein